MFEPTSRYVSLAVKSLAVTGPDGETREIRYVERRFLPPLGTSTTLLEHIAAQGERLDNVTAKYLGDPAQFWRLADANDTFQPEELSDETGRAIVIPLPR